MICARCQIREGINTLTYEFIEPPKDKWHYCDECCTPRLRAHFDRINQMQEKLYDDEITRNEYWRLEEEFREEWKKELAYMKEYSYQENDNTFLPFPKSFLEA